MTKRRGVIVVNERARGVSHFVRDKNQRQKQSYTALAQCLHLVAPFAISSRQAGQVFVSGVGAGFSRALPMKNTTRAMRMKSTTVPTKSPTRNLAPPACTVMARQSPL